jgi:gas vesicle protein GvpL/GvpF
MVERLLYVYAIGAPELADEPLLAELTGVGHGPVRTLARSGVLAVVSAVDAARFAEEPLRHHLEDLHWLEATARAHHGVIDALVARHDIAPLRLATLYRDEANLLGMLEQRADQLRAVLRGIRGRVECGVKGYAVAATPEPPRHARVDTGPGTAYLLRRRAARDEAARGLAEAREQAEQLHRCVASVSCAARRYPPQDPSLAGTRDEMVLNAAYLVERASVAELGERVDRSAGPRLRLQLTGPWAPYSFTPAEAVGST